MKKVLTRFTAHALGTTVFLSSFCSVPAYADYPVQETAKAVAEVAYNSEQYGRPQVLEVSGKPFFYNGIQIRIDKLRDDPNYACGDEELQDLFNQVAEDGFTVANSQIRWTDVQPNHTVYAQESACIKSDEPDTNFSDGGITANRGKGETPSRSYAYIKFKIDDMTPEEIDGANLRLYYTGGEKSGKIKVYGIKNDEWKADDLTWNNAPELEGYDIKESEEITLAGESPEWDKLNSTKVYYDFDVAEYIKKSEYAKDGVVSFMIEEVDPDKEDDTSVSFGGYKDEDQRFRPQLIYADDSEFDFTYLDKAIDFAKNAGLKFEVLWFGTDTCTISSDTRCPVWVLNNYQKTVKSNGTPAWYRSSLSSVTGFYNFIMCKNDEKLREKEAAAVKAMFDHIAERGDDVVIGCQVSNEPGVSRLHGSGIGSGHCMCETCVKKKEELEISNDKEFREVVLWEYNNNLAKAVKTSKYPVWTRVNLDEKADVEGVAFNEKMRKSDQGTYLDFIGIDHYRKTPAALALEGVAGQQFAQGDNLTMLMELGQKDSRGDGLYLAEDTLAALSGGAYVCIYDASSSDGCEIYTYDKGARQFSPIDNVIPNLFKTNNMLKKIGYELATTMPGSAGNNRLIYFNETAQAQKGEQFEKQKIVGENKNITFITEDQGTGIAIDKGEREVALLSTRNDVFILNNLKTAEDILSAETGYYDENNEWVKEEELSASNISSDDNKTMITVPAYHCIRIVTNEEAFGPIGEIVEKEQLIEAEKNYTLQEGLTSETWDDGASAGGWLKVLASKEGDYVILNSEIPKDGIYEMETCYRTGKDRAAVQLMVDGENIEGEDTFDAYNTSAQFTKMLSGKIVLSKGGHSFQYTVTGKNENSSGYIIGLDYLKLTRVSDVADMEQLQTLYDKYSTMEQGNYTDESWRELQETLDKTEKVIKDKTSPQETVDTQYNLLQNAVEKLLVKTDKTKEELAEELSELVDLATGKLNNTEALYQEEDVELVRKRIEEAKTLIRLVEEDDPAVGPEMVATGIVKLQEAVNMLERNEGHFYTEKIEITKEPEQKVYEVGDELNSKGLEVTVFELATSSNADKSEKVNSGVRQRTLAEDEYKVDYDFTSEGTKDVTVSYLAKNAAGNEETFMDSFTVTVGAASEDNYYVEKIEITKKPNKLEYETEEEFDPTGMKVVAYEKASSSNASKRTKELTPEDYDVEHDDFNTAGEKEVTVVYLAENEDGEEEIFTASFTVKVTEAWTDYYTTGIKVQKKPSKTEYKAGEDFDPEGMKVVAYDRRATASNAERRERVLTEDEYDLDIPSFETQGSKTIRVVYEGVDKNGEDKTFKDTFTVKVLGRTVSSNDNDSDSSGSVYTPDDSITGTWQGGQNEPWKFKKSTGTYATNEWAKINGKWYHFDQDSNMQTGWLSDQNKWYLLNPDGSMCADTWAPVNEKWYYFNADGSMKCNEWYFYKEDWYYLGRDGDMLVSDITPDGYQVDSEGKWIR